MTKLRFKKLASGKFSIYTETYHPKTQKRTYHFLKLYVDNDYSKINNISRLDAPIMEQALRMVGTVDEDEDKKLQVTKVTSNKIETHLLLSPYIASTSRSGKGKTKALLTHIDAFTKGKDIALIHVTRDWVLKFEKYLLKKGLSASTVNSHLKTLSTLFNTAVKEKYLFKSPMTHWTQKRDIKREIVYLEDAELERLKNTPVTFDEQVKDAFLFACYTGLRYNDLKTLIKADISQNLATGAYVLLLKYTNSSSAYYLEISQAAKEILQKYFTDGYSPVFDKLHKTSNHILTKLKLWAAYAEVDKELSFTVARDTYAMQQLKAGLDVNSLAQKMGIKTTRHLETYLETLNQINHDNTPLQKA